jgi:hypothetical protein
VGAAAALATGCCGGNDEDVTAQGTFSNRTQQFLNVFTDNGSSIYVRPGQDVSLGFKGSRTVQVAYSPGQDTPAGFVGERTVNCCCTTAATCDVSQCGTLVAQQPGAPPLTLEYTAATCFSPGDGGSCPYIYAFGRDGRAIPQAEVLSAGLFAGAARGDVLPLSDAAVVAGQIKVRVATELHEIDVLTGAALLTIDHEPGVVLATDSDGRLSAVASPLAPSAATSPGLPDQLPLVAERDGAGWVGSFSSGAMRDMLTVHFPAAGAAPRDRLVLVVRNIRSTEQALQRYLAELGPGFPGLLRRLSSLPGYRGKLSKILEDSGLALRVTTSQPGRRPEVRTVLPVGSLGARAVALELPRLDPALPVDVRLDALPAAWDVDTVFLARAANDRVMVSETAAARALKSDGATTVLSERAPHRQTQGQHLDLTFDVPTVAPAALAGAAGRSRSFALAVRGHYELVPGHGRGVDWGLLLARTGPGRDAFGRYLLGDRSERHWSLCPKRIVRELFSARGSGANDDATIACAGPEGDR